MTYILKHIVGIAFFALLFGNIYVFINGVQLSDKIHFYESEVKNLRQENINLEKHVYKFDSISYAASIAAELDYEDSKDMLYVTNPGYALNR